MSIDSMGGFEKPGDHFDEAPVYRENFNTLESHTRSSNRAGHQPFQEAFPLLDFSFREFLIQPRITQREFLIQQRITINNAQMQCSVCGTRAHALEHIMPHLQSKRHKKNLVWAERDVHRLVEMALKEVPTGELQRIPAPINPGALSEAGSCKVCMEKDMTRILLPCRHGGLCADCYMSLHPLICPWCRADVDEYFEIYPC